MSLHHAILGMLNYKPMSGYDFKAIFDESINFFWSAKLSQIYRELGSLESRGLVSSIIEPQTGKPDKKIYHITDEGRAIFRDWMNKFPSVLRAPIREEFSIRVFFGSALQKEELEYQLGKFIKEGREELESLAAVEKIIEVFSREIGKPEERFFWGLVLKRGRMITEASVRWAEESLVELSGARSKERKRNASNRR
ncbi:MAG: PadR family transcriptional regulator [Spirochaetes bacterium]|nr:MAG: PadR family transcriptional regulator [Spirochaetota bacterium]